MKTVTVAETTLTAFTTNAGAIIPPTNKRRSKGTFKGFIDKHGWRYLDKYLIRIWAKAVFKTPEKVVSYIAKSWCRERVLSRGLPPHYLQTFWRSQPLCFASKLMGPIMLGQLSASAGRPCIG
jgi:hypothetical protein